MFDFVILVLTIISMSLEAANVFNSIGSATAVIRCFRIARVLKLIRAANKIRMMFETLIITLPAMINLAALLSIILFVFSILGNNLFPYVRLNNEGGGLTDDANF